MKRGIIILLATILLIPTILAAMNPDLKECMQRGYEITATPNQDTICIFPDNSNCTIKDFNLGICGEEFMIKDYCVKEDLPVWDKDKCCKGLSPCCPGIFGQSMCKSKSYVLKKNIISYSPFIIGLIILIAIIIFIILKFRKK